MNRKIYMGIVSFVSCAAISFLWACGGSSSNSGSGSGGNTTPTIAITANSGYTTSATVGGSFGTFSATVTSNGSPASGVSVTFTAPSSGASGTFATSPAAATDTETTNSSGVATSQIFTANSTAGAYAVTATTTSAVTPASFSLTNNSAAVASNTYVYYLSGQEVPNSLNGGFLDYYSTAGAVTIDANGNILGGEQDYNDASGITSPGEPNTPDTISPATSALVVDPTTGLGTLTLASSNTSVGVNGVETFAVQFVNANHALITQFDGTATSSGSLDLQTATSATGNFAFAMTGVNPNYDSVAYGGVFAATSGGLTGTLDVNDTDGGLVTGSAMAASFGTADGFGRTVVTGVTNPAFPTQPSPVTFVSYVVGSEALRIIDVDTSDSAVGSAFGQGSTTFTNASVGSSVFSLFGQWSVVFGTLGQFGTDGNGNITSGIADDNELDFGLQQEGVSVAGSVYDLTSSGVNGYGTMTMAGTGDVVSLGLYMTDPALNLNDPNNTTTDLGGALIVDLDANSFPGGMGVLTPQTDTTSTDFNGSYAAGFQNINDFGVVNTCDDCELDMVGPFTVNSGLLSTASIGADDSDPLGTISGLESAGDSFSSTPLVVSAGYYSMSLSNLPANPLAATIGEVSGSFDADIYQASGTTLYWLEVDGGGVFLGPIEAQGSLTGIPAVKKPAAKTQERPKTQTVRVFGGGTK